MRNQQQIIYRIMCLAFTCTDLPFCVDEINGSWSNQDQRGNNARESERAVSGFVRRDGACFSHMEYHLRTSAKLIKGSTFRICKNVWPRSLRPVNRKPLIEKLDFGFFGHRSIRDLLIWFLYRYDQIQTCAGTFRN